MAAIAIFSIDCSLSILLIAVVSPFRSFSFFFVSRIRYPRAPVHQITSALRTVACVGDFVLALDSLVLYWGREEVMLDMLGMLSTRERVTEKDICTSQHDFSCSLSGSCICSMVEGISP
jgi:hypothetical protein